jgi:transcriptional regulator with XRE-family HTH domain
VSGGTPLTPGERRERDSARGRRAYDALLAKFEREIDPDGVLDPAERSRRAEQARKEHFTRIGRSGGAARAKSRRPERPPSTSEAPAPTATVTEQCRAAREPSPADWAHLWEQPEMRGLLADRDVAAAYRTLQDFGVSQRQIAALTDQNQPDVSDVARGRRQVYDVRLLERICDGLGIPRPYMRLLDHAPGEHGTYPEKVKVADSLKGVDPAMLRRHLIAWGGIIMAGAPVDKLGEFLDDLGPLPAVPLPSKLTSVHVAQVKDLSQRLEDAARAFGSDPAMSSAAAARAEQLLKVPAAEPVKRALLAAVAHLHIHAGVAAFDGGREARTLYHLARAVELATQADDPYLQALALNWAGLATIEHGHPDDGLKMLQAAQVKSWEIPDREQRVAVEACGLMDSATALAMLGDPPQAYRHAGRSRELWTPPRNAPFGDLDRPAALLEIDRGRLDVAEQLAAASVRLQEGCSERGRTRSGIVLATIHVKAGEQRGLQLAHSAITDVTKLTSARARRQLVPLVDALEARPGTDARELARMARQIAA